ncbi:hypothetical protein ICN42_08390 [Polynucleobacter sp. 71A-WALBACH]|jgi:hypothetical protein|uniref:hypothetical protein n=1 Tax=Polynucleobacter sp. 71A-WALBACH TaxID=2689097 RepID=UPI001C0B753F|nr:hypothetical protein [Polynucleobacter sp. 71A-WALBACH]MBU3594110.1 hypothetical protein [Polynucleobacter sp. 71A-WALBACH]
MKNYFAEAFFRFQRLLQVAEQLPSFPNIDEIESKLLVLVALAERDGHPLLVGDLLCRGEVASQATIHGRISRLHGKQLIQFRTDTDGRKKYVLSTTKANSYFSKIGECVIKAGKS